ncbi:MAG: ABC transporter substrate-binding protein [Gemmatimonadetes bacterium]|nr:ABC transporter substrate-binding protein [Gemmatimonadota bacterium]MYE70210.1 ABC transporter substrate-binding protein [Gemmatimonadota bacterium]MYJ68561.1 ABC transporter substrate-binding protein [Gemmatimonadota bacterium]
MTVGKVNLTLRVSGRGGSAWMHRLAAGLLVVSAGCGGGEDANAIKVGAIFDLTGPTADVGTDYADGMRGFVDWINLQGGIEGRPIDLIYQDYAYQVPRAEQLYSQFVNEGVVAFMGWGTGDTEALKLRIAEDEIPFSSASLSHVLGNPAEAPYNFLLATSYSDQFRIALDWIAQNHGDGAPVVALMHNASPFGTSPARLGGIEFAEARGIDLTLYEMPRGAVDYTGEFSRIRQSGAQYVVFQNTSGPAAVAVQNARSLGLDVTLICLNWCSNGQLVQLAGDAAEGVMGTMPYAPLGFDVPGTRLIRDYLDAKGESIEGKTNAYTQAWWTFAVFAEAMRQVLAAGDELTGANIKAALETFTDFDMLGVTVPLTFTPTDHLGSKGLRIFRVEGGEWVPMTEFIRAPAVP